MAESAVLQHVRGAAPFARLGAAQQAALAAAMQALHCRPGDHLLHQGQPVPGLLLLAGGAARESRQLADGSRRQGLELRAGDWCGMDALFQETSAPQDLVVSAPDTWVLLLTRRALLQLAQQDPHLLPALQAGGDAATVAETALFRGQRRGERVLALRRRHPWAWGSKAVLPILLALLLFIAAGAAPNLALTLALAGAALLLPGLWLLWLVAEWHNDHLIISDQRVIRREKTILAMEEALSEVPLESVHEVSFDIPVRDTFARVFGYGTVFIRTAGDSGNMILPMMTRPADLQQQLLRNRLAFQRHLQERARTAIDAEGDALQQAPLPAPPGFAGHHAPGLLSTCFSDAQGNLVYRKHLSVWLAHIFLPLALLLGASALFLVQLLPVATPVPGPWGLIGSASGMLAGLLWLYWSDWDWRNDMLFIGQTTLRIIHRRPMWLQDHNEQFLLTQVDSVTIVRKGPLNTLMNRGDLLISLIGDDHGAERNFSGVGRPHTVQDEISGQRAAVLARREESEALRRREEFATWIDAWQTRQQRQAGPLL